jgi:hypothetical protein
MATIDLGKIKIVWRGTYAGGTAYTPDDAVVHNGTSYICVANTTGNTPPNATYWNVLAQAGTNGTDVGTTLTTQGDILYRDGSGLQRLAAGTNGQALLTGGSGANPSWGTVSADFVKTGYVEIGSDAASFDMQNCFTSDYDIYKVVFHGRTTTATNARFRFYTGTNTEVTSSSYRYNQWLVTSNSNTNTSGYSSGYTEDNFYPRENVDGNSVHSGNWQIMVFNPFDSAVKTYVQWQYAGFDGSYLRTTIGGGFYDTAESHTGLKFFVSTQNFRAGAQVGCYGFKK